MITNLELKHRGKDSLEGNWGLAIGATIFVWLLTAAFVDSNSNNNDYSSFNALMSILSLVLTGPLTFGLSNVFLKFNRSQSASFKNLFDGFSHFLQTFLLHIIKYIFVILWLLLLIIPGIIAILRYSMAYYIMVDNPGISGMEAIRRSKEMMNGHKVRLFYMWLSFLGWFIFGIVTLGIGFLYVAPYYEATKASFYENLKNGSDFDDFIND